MKIVAPKGGATGAPAAAPAVLGGPFYYVLRHQYRYDISIISTDIVAVKKTSEGHFSTDIVSVQILLQ